MDIGSKVIVDGVVDGVIFKNEPGVIKGKTDVNAHEFVIEFHNKRNSFHNCGGKCASKRGFYLPAKNLTVVGGYKSIW